MAKSATLRAFALLLGMGVFLPGVSAAQQDEPSGAPAEALPTIKAGEFTVEGWFAQPSRQASLPDLPSVVRKAYVIGIREEISTKTFLALHRKAIEARDAGAEIIIFDMDTWGGLVTAAMDISRLIKVDLAEVRTVCYIRNRAVSAGALIALACDEIVMTEVGTLGDAAPISLGGQLTGVEREKTETVLRNEFRESARRHGYSMALAQSMVSADLEVWLIRNKQTMELQYVLASDWTGRVRMPGQTEGNADAEWELLHVMLAEGKLLTVDGPLAKNYGFAAELVSPPLDDVYAPLVKRYNIFEAPTVMEDNWSEALVGVLTSQSVMGLLLFVALLCAYVEINTPGFGIAGAIAIFCFAIIFGSNYLIGLAAWWEIALFFLGLVLLGLEIFVIPGFGIAGIAGIMMMVVAILAMLVPNAPDRLPIPTSPVDWRMFTDGLYSFGLAIVAAVIVGFIISRHLPSIPFARRLMLAPVAVKGDTSYADTSPISKIKVGDTGTVEAVCRPIGKVRFNDELIDACSQGEIIEVGETVVVIRRDGNQIIVERAGN